MSKNSRDQISIAFFGYNLYYIAKKNPIARNNGQRITTLLPMGNVRTDLVSEMICKFKQLLEWPYGGQLLGSSSDFDE